MQFGVRCYTAGSGSGLCPQSTAGSACHIYQPDWVAGISIGAINCAIIAGNAREDRVAKLREFWDRVSSPSANWLDLPQDNLAEGDAADGCDVGALVRPAGLFPPSRVALLDHGDAADQL